MRRDHPSLKPYLSHMAVDLGRKQMIASADVVVWFIGNKKYVHNADSFELQDSY